MVQLAWDPRGRVGRLQTTVRDFVHAVENIFYILLLLFRFTQYQRMLSTLAQCEFSLGKTLMVYDMNLREMENYEKIYTNIGRKCPCAVPT